jgi:hypothetical protein
MPGEGWGELAPGATGGEESGEADGTWVYAISRKPLTDAAWANGGLPSGLKADWSDYSDSCKAKTGLTGVFLCTVKGNGAHPGPRVSAAGTAAHGTKAYYSLVYVPRGADLNKGIKEAQTAASRPVDGRHAHAVVEVKSLAHVRQNTMTPSAPTLPAGGTVQHTVKLHAVDKGYLGISFVPAPGYRNWDLGELKAQVASVAATGPAGGAECDHATGELGWGHEVRCRVSRPGDYTVTYALKAAADTPAWKLRADMAYEVYNFGTYNPAKTADFAVSSPKPVVQRYRLVGRDSSGELWDYTGTGKASPLFRDVNPVGWLQNWNAYSALTRLGPVTVQSTGPGAVGRDKAGVLWFHPVSGDGGIYKGRLKVGAGWNMYNSVVGGGDLTGDGKADLLARETGGVLYVYPGTGTASKPFGGRVKVGAGWNAFNSLAGGADLTGDRKPDLLAREANGKLWLYPGTGVASRPFGARVQVGTGWHVYNSVVVPGDLDSDGRADFVARDAAGVLWFYKGTGAAAAPYAARVKVGGGWQRYNLLF